MKPSEALAAQAIVLQECFESDTPVHAHALIFDLPSSSNDGREIFSIPAASCVVNSARAGIKVTALPFVQRHAFFFR